TRPRVVGQMSELIKEFKGRTFAEWEKWYGERYPNAIGEASNKIYQMLQRFKDALNNINKKTVEIWVKDLVLVKTFIGLKFQEAILRKGAEMMGVDWRFANPEEEAKGVDGFIGETPVSIKPSTYKAKPGLPEQINCKIIYYSKVKDGIYVDYSELF
ncbi:MAG: MjaI family restriction endonuclease, partial [bacterium]